MGVILHIKDGHMITLDELLESLPHSRAATEVAELRAAKTKKEGIINSAIERLLVVGTKQMKGRDCGDSSCHFTEDRSGQRTNASCRCLEGRPLPSALQSGIRNLYSKIKAAERAREDAE